MKIIDALAREFASVDVLSHYGGYYKLRCPRNEKTIGSIFGMIESRKEEFLISEYAVSQTTLEQIFQTFAEASIDDEACWSFNLDSRNELQLRNPDRKSTMVQQRPPVSQAKGDNLVNPSNQLINPSK